MFFHTEVLKYTKLLGKVCPISYKSCAGLCSLNIPKDYEIKV